MLEEITVNGTISMRGRQRLLRVARTLADMEMSEDITEEHLLLASAYKMISKKYWGNEGEAWKI